MPTIPAKPRIRRISAALGLVILVAACTSAGGSSPAPSVAASAAPTTAAAASSGGETYTVAAANGTVGAYLTGEDGKTLYTFKPDSANTSTCTDTCATNWPPFTVESDDTLKAGTGVTGTLATFARADGKMQVAYNGVPLYYFAADTKAGDTMGEGAGGGKWHVASPTGAARASGAPASAAPTKGGYSSDGY